LMHRDFQAAFIFTASKAEATP